MYTKQFFTILCAFVITSGLALQAQNDSMQTTINVSKPECFIESLGLDSVCQPDETTNLELKNFVLPAALISYGFAVKLIPDLKLFDTKLRDKIDYETDFKTKIDDGLVVVPIASVFALDWCGVSARHTFKDRAIVSATSLTFSLGSTFLVKEMTHRWRPDKSEDNSFPSGHTSTAFVGAHILMKEYRDASIWIPISGYAVASGVAGLRMINNRHWFSDVVVGAGFGILSVELSYLLLPYLSKVIIFDKKNKTPNSLTLSPALGNNWAGIGLSFKL